MGRLSVRYAAAAGGLTHRMSQAPALVHMIDGLHMLKKIFRAARARAHPQNTRRPLVGMLHQVSDMPHLPCQIRRRLVNRTAGRRLLAHLGKVGKGILQHERPTLTPSQLL